MVMLLVEEPGLDKTNKDPNIDPFIHKYKSATCESWKVDPRSVIESNSHIS